MQAQPGTVILVRHAEKATTSGPDPELSPIGLQRARDLAAALVDAHVGSVITTQFQRTQLTAVPLMQGTSLAPIVVRAAGAGHPDSVAAAIRRLPAGQVVLVIGHSNTIPAIIAALGGPKLPDLCDSQYASLFVLELAGSGPPRLIKSRYGIADAADTDACSRAVPKP